MADETEDGPELLGSQIDEMKHKSQRDRARNSIKLVRRRSGYTVGEVEAKHRKFTSALQVLKEIKLYQTSEGRDGVDPKLLTSRQRRACILELEHSGVRPIEMAELFGVSKQCIHKDRAKLLRDMGVALQDYNPQQFVGWFIEQANYHAAIFKKKGLDHLSWSVTQDLARQLTNWGMVVPPETMQRMAGGGDSVKRVQSPLELLTDEELAAIERIVNKPPTGTEGAQ